MIHKYAPKGANIIVVDDASTVPVQEATYRFDMNVGIAGAKNKCLELLEGYDHIFLFDDDTYPVCDGWEQPYIDSPEPHLMYIFMHLIRQRLHDSTEIFRDSKLHAYSHPRGCMLYLDRKVLDVVGGMDTRYGRWGYEHVDYSNRIYNAGLTSFRYADVVGSNKLIHSGDEHIEVKSSVPSAEKISSANITLEHFKRNYKSRAYCNYKPAQLVGKNNIVLTTYMVGKPDPQRGQWVAKYDDTKVLRESVTKHGQKIVILHDCFDDVKPDPGVTLQRIETVLSPYFQRWLSCYQYLRDHPEIDNVFCVDATDVEMLKNPFASMTDCLYTGDEQLDLGDPWMVRHHNTKILLPYIKRNSKKQLLNAGILGGSRQRVMEFCHELIRVYLDNGKHIGLGQLDMGVFNLIAYRNFSEVLSHGSHVNTRFKSFDYKNTESWWRHK